MPAGWTGFYFLDLINDGILLIGDGYRAKNNELGGTGPIFLRSQHVKDSRIDLSGIDRFHADLADVVASKMSKPGDVIITTKGNSTGRVSYVAPNLPAFVYSPHLSFWRSLKPDILLPDYLRYWSRGKEFQQQLCGLSCSTDMAPYLSLTDQRRLKIALPPIEEQRAIARILSSLDDKIELNRHMNETLEAIARAIFKSWFVDFDPVRAKAEGREPVGMDAETAALFPDSFEETELGMVPKGWGVGSFDETIELIGGGTPKTSVPEYWNGDIPWFSIADAPENSDIFVIDTEKKITKRGIDESSTRLLPAGTTIITARGTVGKCAIVGIPMAMNQSCYGIRGRCKRGNYFTYFALSNLVSELKRSTHGSVFDTITRETFITVRSVIVPVKLTRIFDEKSSSFMEQIIVNLQESKNLAAICNILLPKLISGKLNVDNCRIGKESV